MTDKEELAALKARVAELEAKAKPPEPFVRALSEVRSNRQYEYAALGVAGDGRGRARSPDA